VPKIYTRTGDGGTTHLIGGRTSKADPQIEAIGTVDELNAAIGAALAFEVGMGTRGTLSRIQGELFTLGAELAVGPKPGRDVPKLGDEQITALEHDIDAATEQLAPLKNFVLPGGSKSAALLHVARAVCRRAERCVVTLGVKARAELQRYLNRLSDLLFTLARAENARVGVAEPTWSS
jgi:cob(I)alamin adenosyltransferase